jgi:DNA-binding transcriptional LysR family regulator
MPIRPNIASRPVIGQLATFIAVAETRSFRRAAERVGRSQPAVTAQINQLEAMLGVQLFTRTTRQVRTTPVGDALLVRAKRLVAETDQLIRDFQDRADLESRRITVSVSPTVAAGIMARLLVAFEADHPKVTVSIREDLGPDMVEGLETGSVDFGVGPYGSVPKQLQFQPLFRQTFFLILRRDHPLARRRKARLADLEGLDLLCPARGTTARSVLEEAVAAAGMDIRPKYEALQYHTLIGMVAAGLGGTVMPMTSRPLLDALGLKALAIADADLSRDVGLLTRRDQELSPVATAFVDLLFRTAKESSNDPD